MTSSMTLLAAADSAVVVEPEFASESELPALYESVEVQLEIDNNWYSSRLASVEKDASVSAQVVAPMVVQE